MRLASRSNYSPDTIVGEPGGGNVIAGNGLGTVNGANVYLIDSSGSVVQSNLIGTDITGTVALSTTTYYGVALEPSGRTPSVDSRPHRARDWATSSRAMASWHFRGQLILADPTPSPSKAISSAPMRPASTRCQIAMEALVSVTVSLVTVGGTAAGAGNLISGNSADGVVYRPSRVRPLEHVVEGNLIGTDITGEAGDRQQGGRRHLRWRPRR